MLDQMEALDQVKGLGAVRGMLDQVIACVREVAAREVMPRYLKVAQQRKSDGSLFTEADLASQEALSRVLPPSIPVPSLPRR
jgi:myo-inositol-1(or 4)-monophosphatase